MELAQELIYLAIGFYFLAKGSDWLVEGSSVVAKRMGVRQLVVGLTVVAWGTSAPEVVVSSLAAIEDDVGISMGNVLGSNVANIGLVLGVSALILPDVLHGALGRRETFWLIASVAIFWWASSDYEVDRADAAILLGCVTLYNLQLLWEARQFSVGRKDRPALEGNWLARNPSALMILGGLAIAGAAWLTLEGAQGLARRAGLSNSVIGLTVVAIGTSLPELAAGVSGALKGHSDISIGNVVGSNVFNVLAVVGAVALIHPFGGQAEPEIASVLERMVSVDFPIVMGFSAAAILIPAFGGERGGRLKGALLLAAYLSYMLLTVLTA
ncbi:MAG: cation:H+ antiporter [Planctomycetota bacterium]|jgi:cation:H+ antiporter